MIRQQYRRLLSDQGHLLNNTILVFGYFDNNRIAAYLFLFVE